MLGHDALSPTVFTTLLFLFLTFDDTAVFGKSVVAEHTKASKKGQSCSKKFVKRGHIYLDVRLSLKFIEVADICALDALNHYGDDGAEAAQYDLLVSRSCNSHQLD